jgi:uncharacterized membrane protein
MSKPMFFFTGVYETIEAAERDYDAIKRLHHDGEIGSYDAAVLSKDASGDVEVHKDEKPVRHAAWVGAAAGAGVAILFPATLPLAMAGGGAGVGAWFGHMAHGMKRSDAEEMATMLEPGRAGLVVVGIDESAAKVEEATRGSISHATKHLEDSNFEQAEEQARWAFERQEQPVDAV